MASLRRQLWCVLCVLLGGVAFARSPAPLEPVPATRLRPEGQALLIATRAAGEALVPELRDAAMVAASSVRTLGIANLRVLAGAEAKGWEEGVSVALLSAPRALFVYVVGPVRCSSEAGELGRLADRLRGVPEALLVFDVTCPDGPPKLEGAAGVAVLGAAARERRLVEGHGAFTWLLLHGLRGRADRDRNGAITLGELASFIRSRWPRSEPLTVRLGEHGPTAWVSGLDPAATSASFIEAQLTVHVEGEGASVFVDGVHHPGPPPLVLDGVTPGRHLVSVRTASGTRSLAVELAAGERRSLHFDLPPAPTIRIDAGGVEAEVEIDGKPSGTAPTERVVARGRRRLTLSHPAFKTLETSVEVRTGAERFDFELTPLDRVFAWSPLMPHVEFGMRLEPSLWMSVRAHALTAGWAPLDASAWIFGGLSLLVRRPLWDPVTAWGGFEVYGGVFAEVMNLLGPSAAPGSGGLESRLEEALVVGSVVGVAAQLRWFQLGVELHTGYSEGEVVAYLLPTLSIRHGF